MSTSLSFVATVAQTAIQVTAAFAPVPALKPAADILCRIIELCDNVRTNKQDIVQLKDRCCGMLIALRDSANTLLPETMQQCIGETEHILMEIYDMLYSWNKKKRCVQFFRQDDINDDIRKFERDMNTLMMKFEITSHVEIHKWQGAHSKKMDRGLVGIMRKLDLLATDHHEAETIKRSNTEIQNVLRTAQKSLKQSPNPGVQTQLKVNLHQVLAETNQLLPDFNLKNGEVEIIGSFPVGGTSSMDLWEGIYLKREKVVVKVLRAAHCDPKTLKRFEREVAVWSEVWKVDRGAHILPFYGFSLTDGQFPYMVSPWQVNGNAIDFVKLHDASVNYKSLIEGIAKGVQVLHSMDPPVVHGDLRGPNIYIDRMGNPRLADFGLARFVVDVSGTPFTLSHNIPDSERWFAPEVCQEDGLVSKYSDIYSFAATCLELLTHEKPFSHIKQNMTVVVKRARGEMPKLPSNPRVIQRGLDEPMWNLMVRCWNFNPSSRPSIEQVLATFQS